MKSFLGLLSFILFSVFCSNSQISEISEILLSKGEVPEVLINPTYNKVENEKENVGKNTKKRRIRKSKDKFITNSSYSVFELLTSGKVVFNDTISVLLNSIKDDLLFDQPILKEKIRIFTFKSSSVNALAYNDGTILVTTGLISRLTTEAQLAFVLSHEISHVINGDPLNSYVERAEIIKKDFEFKKLNSAEKFAFMAKKSKQTEMSADLHGYKLFIKSNYSRTAPIEVFEIFKKSNLPYSFHLESVDWNKFFSDSEIPLGWLSDLDLSEEYEDTSIDEELSTHPALDQRIASAKLSLNFYFGDIEFKNKRSWFLHCRELSRYQNAVELVELNKLDEALFNLLLLEREFGVTKFSSFLKLRTLVEMSQISDVSEFIKRQNRWSDSFGILLTICSKDFFESQTGVLALKLAEEYPEEIYAKDVLASMENISSVERQILNDYGVSMDFLVPKVIMTSFGQTKIKPDKSRKKYLKAFLKDTSRIESIIVLNPNYIFYDSTKGVKKIKSEYKVKNLGEALKYASESSSIKASFLNVHDLEKPDVGVLSEIEVLENFIDYSWSHLENEMPNPYKGEIDQIIKKYNSHHVVLTGVNSSLQRKNVLHYVAMIVMPISIVGIPFSAYMLLDRELESTYFFMVYDLKKEEVSFIDFRYIAKPATNLSVNTNMYNYIRILSKD